MTTLEVYFYRQTIGDIYNGLDEVKAEIESVTDEMQSGKKDMEKTTIEKRIENSRTKLTDLERELGEYRTGIIRIFRYFRTHAIAILEEDRNRLYNGAVRAPNKLNHVKKKFNNMVAIFNRIWNACLAMLDIDVIPTGADKV